jgi:hypothetical protein
MPSRGYGGVAGAPGRPGSSSVKSKTESDTSLENALSKEPIIQRKWTSREKLIVIVACAFLIAVTPMFIYIFLQAHAANKAFADFSQALIAKDYSQAYRLTDTEFQSAMDEEAFINQQTWLCSKLGELTSVHQDSFDTKELHGVWSSDISANFVFGRAERKFDFTLKKRGTAWKVFGYKERD